MRRLTNDCYIDMKNHIIAVDAPTLEEAREKAVDYLRRFGIPNMYAFLHNLGMTNSEILALEMTPREESEMLEGTLSEEDIADIIYENMSEDITPMGEMALYELFDIT